MAVNDPILNFEANNLTNSLNFLTIAPKYGYQTQSKNTFKRNIKKFPKYTNTFYTLS